MPPEPITWSSSDRADYHRKDAARFLEMAETQVRPSIRDQLILLAQEFYRMAEDARHRLRAVPDKVSPAYSDVAEPRTATGKS